MFKDKLDKQRDYSKNNPNNNYYQRLEILKKLKQSIISHTNDITKALYLDLNKSHEESYITEIAQVIMELNFLIKNLKKFMKPNKVKTPLTVFPAKSYIVPEKLGVVLVISPWNYPFLLALNPIVGALAAGNSVVLKPSEFSINTNKIIKDILLDVLTSNEIIIVEGEVEVTTELLKNRFDHIFFTGSTNVGKVIMNAASNHLTPVTLELGGKSPAIIYDDSDIDLVAKRIVFGKTINAGQTCIAPDYVMIKKERLNEFKNSFKKYLNIFYNKDILNDDNYPKIVTNRHLNRLIELIKDEEIILGGNNNGSKLEPTLLVTNKESKIMSEEIFGPVLPIIFYEDDLEPIEYLKTLEKPLALYLFTNSKKIKELYTNNTSSGALVFNDTVVHFTNGNLPFGGVGHSGMGKYHGKSTFETFSHYKAILDKKNYLDINIRYQPYTKKKFNLIKKILK